MRTRTFFAELRRRNVWRASVLYIGAVWALAQGISQLGPSVGAPDWTTRWFLVAAAIGFVPWLAFVWFYEWTPEGLKRESEIAPGDSIAHQTGRKLDFWIIGILAIAVVLLLTNQFVLRRDVTSMANNAAARGLVATLSRLPEKSVAVLPLANESGDPKQRYFSDGMSEELISDLTQIDGLKVIGQYSSFKLRDSKASPAQIGVMLGVTHLIQGSVRQQGDRVRVVVNMIRAVDGSSVWSHTYDEQLKDVFAIQTQIGHAVAAALEIKLLDLAIVSDDKPAGGNVEAYQFMLRGRTLERGASSADEYRRAIALLKQAVRIDPGYAYAWAVLSYASLNLGNSLTGDARQQAYAQARDAAARQQKLAPDAATTDLVRGSLLLQLDNNPVGALAEFKRAYILQPKDATTLGLLANGLMYAGQLQPAAQLLRKAIAIDPLRTDFYVALAAALLGQGQLDDAEQVTRRALMLEPHYLELYSNLATIDIARDQLDAAGEAVRKALTLQPDASGLYVNLATIDVLRGDAAGAEGDAEKETDPLFGPWIRVLAKQTGPDHQEADAQLQSYVATNGDAQPYFVADLYAVRKQPDQMFDWLQRALTRQDPNFFNYLLNDPFVLAYRNDPRFAQLCKQAGLQLPVKSLSIPTSTSTTTV